MSTFSFKQHDGRNGTIIAACDKELVGKIFTEDGVTLRVTETFYGGDPVGIKEIVTAANRCMTTNFVGEQLIAALQEEDVVSEDEIRYVDDVPHVQLVFI